MRRSKEWTSGRSPNQPTRQWRLFAVSIASPTATALLCLVANAQGIEARLPPAPAQPVSDGAAPVLDGGAPDEASDVSQVATIQVTGSPAVDASPGPDETGQAALDAGTPATIDAQAAHVDDVALGAPGPSATSPLPSRTSHDSPTVLHEKALGQRPARMPYAGLGIDFGVSGVLPDAGLLLTARPGTWLHVQLGAGYNGLSPGVRAGVSLINPIVIPLSLTLEGGHYFEGDANKAVHWFSPDTRDITSLKHFSYDYMNLLGGLTIQERHFCFYIRGGVTWMRTTVKDFSQSVQEVAQVDLQAEDPKVHYRGPSAKIGVIVFP
jgi:hypothetical protein